MRMNKRVRAQAKKLKKQLAEATKQKRKAPAGQVTAAEEKVARLGNAFLDLTQPKSTPSKNTIVKV